MPPACPQGGKVGLIDFGQSKQLTREEIEGLARLTVAATERHVDCKALAEAVWDLGVVTGRTDPGIYPVVARMATDMFDTRGVIDPFSPDRQVLHFFQPRQAKCCTFPVRLVLIFPGPHLAIAVQSSKRASTSSRGTSSSSSGRARCQNPHVTSHLDGRHCVETAANSAWRWSPLPFCAFGFQLRSFCAFGFRLRWKADGPFVLIAAPEGTQGGHGTTRELELSRIMAPFSPQGLVMTADGFPMRRSDL